jgi:hypothetical protein
VRASNSAKEACDRDRRSIALSRAAALCPEYRADFCCCRGYTGGRHLRPDGLIEWALARMTS